MKVLNSSDRFTNNVSASTHHLNCITAIDENNVIVGNGVGDVVQIDLRKMKESNKYKTFHGSVRSIVEKPEVPASNYAVTGLYFLDGSAPQRAAQVKPSARGELEITSLLESYLADGILQVSLMGRGYAWLDTGTHASLLDAGNFVRTLEERQGLQTGSPDEIAYVQGWISDEQLSERASVIGKNAYGQYLERLID